jgi:hypothetical protein
LRQKPNFFDAVVDDSESELQNIAAGRIIDLYRRVRVDHFAGIARVLEMIENLSRIHRTKLYRVNVARAPSPAWSGSYADTRDSGTHLEINFDRLNQRHQPADQLLMHRVRTIGVEGSLVGEFHRASQLVPLSTR